MSYYGWAPYVSVAQRRAKANREMDKLRKKGVQVSQVGPIAGRKIAKTFWGEGWCNHLEQFSDYENRLPRGRTYVRNGSVCHLAIAEGKIEAIVSGSELYKINIQIKTMPRDKWAYIRQSCTGRIGSLLELLQGRFSDEVMRVVTDRKDGLFPLPGEITFDCSCPDWAVMCKHVAAVLYGVGARLDQSPELIFKLRGVDSGDLIGGEALAAATSAGQGGERRRRLKGDVASVFGVELDESAPQPEVAAAKNMKAAKSRPKAAKKARTKSLQESSKPAAAQPTKSKETSAARRKLPRKRKASVNASDLKQSGLMHQEKSVGTEALTGKFFVSLRKKLGLSAAAFGERVGVSAQTIYNWEKKKQPLRLRVATEKRLREMMSSSQ
jgi:uncharacterized Zn finger protein/DNA-binding XRE family transcriptional regulator